MIDFTPVKPARGNLHNSVAPVVLKGRKPAEHEQKQQSAAATNDNRQEHGQRGFSGINLMGACHTDAIRDQAPGQRNEPTATWHQLKRRRRTLGKKEKKENTVLLHLSFFACS